jgi:hypothetical protein
MTAQFVTGADERMFFQTLILLQSFANVGATHAIKVCDFGLTPGQQSFLAAYDQLLVADPPIPESHRHPWYCKAALADFVGHDVDIVIWLDADVMVTRDPRSEIAALIAEMQRTGAVIAACKDASELNLAGFCRKWKEEGRNVSPFVRLLSQLGVAPHHPYLNSGVFVATTREWLLEWKKTTFDIERHVVFEQNAFNALAWLTPRRVRFLDERRWNVHGVDLDRISLGKDLSSLRCDDLDVLVVHATSTEVRHLRRVQGKIKIRDKLLTPSLRFFNHSGLKAQQRAFLDQFMRSHKAELAKYL